MEFFIWVIVILICLVTIVLTMLTSVSKWSNKVVKKYAKEDSKEIKTGSDSPSDTSM